MANKMEKPILSKDEVIKAIKSFKSGKGAGNDQIKPEIMKWLADNNILIELYTRLLNKLISNGETLQKWNYSKTVFVPKCKNPKVHEFRPICLNDMSYKITMKLMKEKLIAHIDNNLLGNETQAGFTKNSRVENNVFILNYVIKDSYRRNEKLYICAIDFAKAFDSIKREHILKALIKINSHPNIIDLITKVYTNDNTKPYLNNTIIDDVKVTTGIRQGCTFSPKLFILVLNTILKSIYESTIGFKNHKFFIPALFFADDGVLLANSPVEIAKLIKITKDTALECGLDLNENKSHIMIFNDKENELRSINGIKVVTEIKYLGVTINNSRNCFKNHKNNKIKQARKLSNLTFSVISKSSNKILIGKTYWKNVAIPSILYGSNFITITKELEELQKLENQVWRHILGAPHHAPVSTLRGEIGSSAALSRDIKNKLEFVRYTITERNSLIKSVMIEMIDSLLDTKWLEIIKNYYQITGVKSIDQLQTIDKRELKRKIEKWDWREWSKDVNGKTTLGIYKKFKDSIKEEKIYNNSYSSVLLYQCRSNSIKLNWRKAFEGGNTKCLCNEAVETVEHTLLYCKHLSPYGNK